MSAPARLHSVPPSFADAFGHRQLVFDPTAGTSLEVLKFADLFSKSPEFETALRERTEALKHIHHPSLGIVHRVERDGEALLLLSKHTPGRRVAELQAKAQGAAFALELIRLVTPLLATLEKAGPGMSHGAISADRIVVTRDGRLVVVEHVLGSALNALKLSRTQLAEIGLIVPPGLPGSEPAQPVLDSRADIAQLSFLALSLLLGRPLSATDYPDKVSGLLDEFVMAAGSPMLAAKMRSWLERSMQLSPKSFASAAEATDAAKDLPDDLDVRVHNSLSQFPSEAVSLPRAGSKSAERTAPTEAKAAIAATATPASVVPPGKDRGRRLLAGWLIAGLGTIAIAEGIALFVWPYVQTAPPVIEVRPAVAVAPPPVAAVPDPATVASAIPDAGPGVAATAPPQTQQASLTGPTVPSAANAAATPVKTDTVATPAAEPVAQGPRFGGLTISSPLDLQVFEGGKLLGTSLGQLAVNEGTHLFEFVNEPTGFRYSQSVMVRAGKMTNLSIAVPKGRISINAVPWAEVLIDGTAAGQTPLANLSLPIGTHEIVFRHPQFGERKQTVVVKVEGLAKVTQTLQPGGGSQ
jgi:hypothetical protein